MTISSQQGRQAYAGDGVSTVFTVPFKFFQNSDLTVILQSASGGDTTLTENVHYTVTGAGSDSGGTVTMATAPAIGETLSILLDPELTQPADYISNDVFPAETHERALDRLTQQNIRTRDIVNRALRLPDGDASVMPTLPGAATRAGKFLRFDNNGDPEMATGIDQSQTLSQSVIGQFLYPQTPAEVSAGVTPVNYAYPPNAYDVRRTGTPTNSTSDALQGLQRAFDACTGVIYVPRAEYLISDTLHVPDGIEIYCEPGTTFRASGLNYNLLQLHGSARIRGLRLVRAAAAQNTSWAAIEADTDVQELTANSRIFLHDLRIENFDIGVYINGGIDDELVDYFEISGSRIFTNTSGTGGALSVRPTVAPNNCKHAAILRCYLDASDSTNSVNNIYAIGNTKLDVVGNWLKYGHAIKVISNPGRPSELVSIKGNVIESATVGINLQAASSPIRIVNIEGNEFLTPQTAESDVGIIIASVLDSVAPAFAFDTIISKGNHFRAAPCSVYYIAMSSGEAFGTLVCDSNVYRSTSTGDSGLYGIVNWSSEGTYQALIASNELVLGENTTRGYLQGSSMHDSVFSVTSMSNVVELQTAQKTANTGTYTGTLTNVSGTVTGTIRYTIDGSRQVHLNIPTIQGTSSNTTQKKITGMPALIRPANTQIVVGVCVDNGTGKVSSIQIETNGDLTLFNGLSATFTASGTCGITHSTISYPLD